MRSSAIRLVLAGVGLSSLGDYLALTALTVWVHDVTRSSWAVTGLVLAGLLPLVVLGPAAGLLVDRVDPVRLLRATLAVQVGVAAAIAFTTSYPALLVLAFALGTGAAVTQVALLALLPSLVQEERPGRANGWMEASRSIGTTLGPPLGGLVAAVWSTRGALLADTGTFAALCAAMLAIPAGRNGTGPVGARAVRAGWVPGEMLEGVRHMASEPFLRLAGGVLVGATLFLASLNVIEVFFAKDTLHAGSAGYGAMVGCWGLGMMLGALLTGRLAVPRAFATVVVAGCVVAGAAVVAPAAFPFLSVALGGWFLAGVTNGAYHVAVRSLIHERIPPELHGRAFAAQYGAYTAAKIGSMLLGGFLVGWLAPRTSVLAVGAAVAAIGLGGLLLRRTLPAAPHAREPREPREPQYQHSRIPS